MQIIVAMMAMGLGFMPAFFWWLFVPIVLCIVGWRLTRHASEGYINRDRD